MSELKSSYVTWMGERQAFKAQHADPGTTFDELVLSVYDNGTIDGEKAAFLMGLSAYEFKLVLKKRGM